MDTLAQIVKEFGYESFRGDQEKVIRSVLAKKDTLCLMPTGMGKSLCYLIPAKILGSQPAHLTVVVSPLIALMQDQVVKAKKKGLKATDIHSLVGKQEREKRYKRLAEGGYELIFVAPERFRKEEFLKALSANTVNLLAIDEAHCISEWGHDFRPDYTRIHEFRKRMNNPTTLMLTATATPLVQEDIIKQAGLEWDKVEKFHSGIARKNLSLNVLDLYGFENKVEALEKVLKDIKGSTIVYFSLISTLEKASQKLKAPHLKYHGQLPRGIRAKMQKEFLNGEGGIILATPAFGLGIDKANIRSVIHFEPPGNLESYYQEVGRAGRDGLDSKCYLLYDEDDVTIQMEFIKWAHPDPEFIHRVHTLLKSDIARANGEGLDGLREQLLFKSKKDFRLETTLNLFERWDVTTGDILHKDLSVVSEIPEKMLDAEKNKQRLINDQKKLLALVQWVGTNNCRAQEIYKYFGFDEFPPCGKCDNDEKI